MKKLFFFTTTISLLSFFTLCTQPVSAHFLATDNNIGAVLHVDPNDEPVAGEQASFFFAFKDKENKFIPQNCDCTFEVDENGKSIFAQPLFQNNNNPSLSNASVFYTFPQKDVYTVKVVGKPVTPNSFQPFTLLWNFRVDQQANQQGSSTNNLSLTKLFLLGIGIVVVVIGVLLLVLRLAKKQTLLKGGETDDKKTHTNSSDNRNTSTY